MTIIAFIECKRLLKVFLISVQPTGIFSSVTYMQKDRHLHVVKILILPQAVKDTVEVIRRGSTKLHPLSRLTGEATERMSQLYCLFNTKETIIAREVFNFFDVNRDGFIDAVDLQVVLERLGIPQGAEECRAMIVMAIPTNMMLLDGKMNLTQFTQFFLTAWAEPPPRRY